MAPGSTSTPPGMPFHQVCFPPSPSPLPAWIAIRHVSAAVRLQAAARGLLVRRRVREMRDLQLQLLQVALHCATDLDLVRCVGDLGRAVSPTGGGHAVFPAGSDLKVCAIDSHSAGRRHGVTDRSAPRSTTAFRRRPPRGLLLSRWFPWDPGGCTGARPTSGRCPLYVQGSTIKRPSPFQVESNKTSRDVKGSFLGVRFVLRRVMVCLGCSSRTSCVSRWGVVLEYVMGLGPLVLWFA